MIPRGAGTDYVVPSQRISSALEAAGFPFDGPIAAWDDWERVIANHRPELLIVLGHAIADRNRGEPAMQIGASSNLYVSRVFEKHVHTPPGVPGPVVLLFGCLTATEGSEQVPFTRKFRQHNASVVIGTTSTVLGRQSGPVAAGLITAIKANGQQQVIGEMLRQTRANGLAAGSVMAMTLNAFGDADYRVTA